MLPSSVRVGYRDYSILEWSSIDASSARRLGEADHHALVIRVRTDLPRQLIAEVLLHEVLHCCFWSGAIEHRDTEERIVLTLGNQLAQVWRDNPAFVTFMSDHLSPPRSPQQ